MLAVSGATQFLVVTWGAAPAPRRGVASAQRWMVVVGVLLVAFGRERSLDWVTATGGVAVAGALMILGVVLVAIAVAWCSSGSVLPLSHTSSASDSVLWESPWEHCSVLAAAVAGTCGYGTCTRR